MENNETITLTKKQFRKCFEGSLNFDILMYGKMEEERKVSTELIEKYLDYWQYIAVESVEMPYFTDIEKLKDYLFEKEYKEYTGEDNENRAKN